MMPGMSGIETLEDACGKSQSPSDLPVIMVTAKHASKDVVEALDLGANDYVTKPVDLRGGAGANPHAGHRATRRSADRPGESGAVHGRLKRLMARDRAAGGQGFACSSSTSIASSSSTTASATLPATSCCRHRASARNVAAIDRHGGALRTASTRSRAWAATSSRCCSTACAMPRTTPACRRAAAVAVAAAVRPPGPRSLHVDQRWHRDRATRATSAAKTWCATPIRRCIARRRSGKARCEIFDTSMLAEADEQRLQFESDLRHALAAERAAGLLPADRRARRKGVSPGSRRCCGGTIPSTASSAGRRSFRSPRRPG